MKNIVKNATRHLVAKAYETFAKGKKAISVISLPGDVWEFENYVLSNRDFAYRFGYWYGLDMTLVERDEFVHSRHSYARKSFRPDNTNSYYVLGNNNVSYKNELLNESHVKNCKHNNIFAWFDFCGNPTSENVNLINTATGKNVTYIFTFNTAWRMDTNVDPALRHLAALHENKGLAIKLHFEKLAEQLGLTLIWCFDYVANYAPMISVCLSNDVNVIADESLQIHSINTSRKNRVTQRSNTPITRAVTVKRDLSAVYVDVKAKMNDDSVCAKHNVSVNTLAAVKAWITMGK
jgi:hypothetical protein